MHEIAVVETGKMRTAHHAVFNTQPRQLPLFYRVFDIRLLVWWGSTRLNVMRR